MRNVLLIALLVPAMALAVSTVPVTVLPENGVATPVHKTSDVRQSPKATLPLVGTVDTVGGSTYDWWSNGAIWRQIANSPGYGLHVTWMYSQEMAATTFPDRQMRYNFYDYAVGAWNWIDPDYMQSGVNVWVDRSGYGNLADDPTTGCAVIGRHTAATGTMHVDCARDIAPGAGIFEYAEGSPTTDGYQWPPLATDAAGVIHQFLITDAYALAYTRITVFPTYEPLYTSGWDPLGTFPTHNIAASRVSSKLCATWTDNLDPVSTGFMRTSEDGGTTWGTTQTLTPPRVYGGDTLASFAITSIFPYYDGGDRLHLFATIGPNVNDTGYIFPAVIAHYLDGSWNEVHRAGCDAANLQGSVGYNTIYAGRASVGEDADQNLYVVWEQFDSANVEPVTSLLRADIFGSGSADHGATWGAALKLTEAGTHSNRFPSISNWIDSDNNMVDVLYINDQTAGFWVQNEHPGEVNPVFVQHVPKVEWPMAGGVEEGRAVPTRTELSVAPNPVPGRGVVSYALPRAGNVSLVVYDAAGRPVRTLASGYRQAGRHNATLDAGSLTNGVYFCTLTSGSNSVSKKLTVTH
jgi:hypothetical protein